MRRLCWLVCLGLIAFSGPTDIGAADIHASGCSVSWLQSVSVPCWPTLFSSRTMSRNPPVQPTRFPLSPIQNVRFGLGVGLGFGGGAAGAVTVSVAERLIPLYVPVIETLVAAVTDRVSMANVAVDAPVATVTDAGTRATAVLPLCSDTMTALVAAALNVTSPVG